MNSIENTEAVYKNSKVEGLLVRLFRRFKPGNDDSNSDDDSDRSDISDYGAKAYENADYIPYFQYKMWYVFSGMTIHRIKAIENVCTGNTTAIDEINNKSTNPCRFCEEKVLCLYTYIMDNNGIIDPEYSIKAGSSDIAMPYIGLTEVKLDDACIAFEGPDYCQELIGNLLAKGCDRKNPGQHDFYNYKVYRSLGYGDFTIIFRSHSYQGIFNGINSLRNGGKKYAGNLIAGASSTVGVSQNHMLNHMLHINNTQHINNSGCIKDIRPKLPRMSWTFPGSLSKSLLYSNLNKILAALKPGLPVTLYHPLQNLLYKCEHLSQSKHTSPLFYELPGIVSTLFLIITESLGCRINKNTLMYEHIPCKIISQIAANISNNSHSRVNTDSLMSAIQTLLDFLGDRMYAGSFFSETAAVNLKLKEPISKLLIAYSTLITTVTKEIRQCLEKLNAGRALNKMIVDLNPGLKPNLNPDLTILLNLDILNQIGSSLFFPESSFNLPCRFVSINCDVISLFHIDYTVCLIVHEIAHYIRPLDCKRLNSCFLKMICGQLTQKALSFMFDNAKPGSKKLSNAKPDNEKPAYARSIADKSIDDRSINDRSIDDMSINYKSIDDMSINYRSIDDMPINDKLIADKCMQFFSIIVEYMETALYEIIWTSLAENEKSLVFSEFKDRLYTFITNSLGYIEHCTGNAGHADYADFTDYTSDYIAGYTADNISDPVPGDDCSRPAPTGNKQLRIWKHMMDKLFTDATNKLKQQLIPARGSECEEIAGYLASCWLHEDIPENRTCFAREFIYILKSQEIKDFVMEASKRTKSFFDEVIADIYMCCLLGLGNEEYLDLVHSFFKSSYGINLNDFIEKSAGSNSHYDSVTIQARIWMIMALFNCQQARGNAHTPGDTAHESRDNAHENRDTTHESRDNAHADREPGYNRLESSYNRVLSFIKEIRGEYLFKYMEEVRDFCINELLGSNCPELTELRKNYGELSAPGDKPTLTQGNNYCPDNGDYCGKLSRQFCFIEYYWLKGISKLIDKGRACK